MTDILPPAKGTHEPLFNMPPLTFGLLLGFTAIHITRLLSLSADQTMENGLAFIPVAFTAHPFPQLHTLLGYGLLHFGWLHFFTNMTGFMAFGSGVERFFGKAWLAFLLAGGTIIGALGHWALAPQDLTPLVGASAGISALFGALLPLLAQGRNFRIMVAVFVVTNIVIGVMGMPDQPGLSIAWQAHLFGFAFGLAASHLKTRYAKKAKAVAVTQNPSV